MTKRKLIILTGPTAVGKSDLAVKLAGHIGGEIISADSMQVYRGMNIGTAKITPREMQGIPHHLIDVLDPGDAFDVTRFQQMTKTVMEEIYQRGNVPIIAGGTGFYIQSVLYDIAFTPNAEEEGNSIRQELEKIAQNEDGRKSLYKRLQDVDPESADIIHPNNIKRVIRALEYYEQTGGKISVHNETEHQRLSPYDFRYFVLTDDRSAIYERIDRRVDRMMEEGLLEEVIFLKEKGYPRSSVSMQGIGYKELLAYLDGECTLDEAVYLIKLNTRHFAKRQLTWFRREKDVIWIDRREEDPLTQILSKL